MRKDNAGRTWRIDVLFLIALVHCRIAFAAPPHSAGAVQSDFPHFELRGHPGTVVSACFVDDRFLASGDSSGNLFLWNLNNRKKIKSILANHGETGIRQLQYEDGTIYGIGKNGNLIGWDKTDLSEKKVVYLPLDARSFVAFPTERVVYASARGGIWHVTWDSERRRITPSNCYFHAFIPGTQKCLVYDRGTRQIAIFDLKKETIQKQLEINAFNISRFTATDGARIAFQMKDQGSNTIQIVHINNGTVDSIPQPHQYLRHLCFSHDGKFLACSGQSTQIGQKIRRGAYSSHSIWRLSPPKRLRMNCREGNLAAFKNHTILRLTSWLVDYEVSGSRSRRPQKKRIRIR